MGKTKIKSKKRKGFGLVPTGIKNSDNDNVNGTDSNVNNLNFILGSAG